jgi:hypothetical protein
MMTLINFREIIPGKHWYRRIALLAVAWFFLCLAVGAPAQLLVVVLKPLLPQLQLHNVDGGFWRGSAGASFWQQGDKVIALGKTEWDINPWSLLWLHPSAHISTHYDEQYVESRVRVSPWGGLALRDLSAAVPVQLIGFWVPVPAKGLLALKLQAVDIAHARVIAATGDAYWQRAQWQWGNQWLGLGDYRCALQVDKSGSLHCALQSQGALAGNGDVSIDFKQNNWSADLRVQAAPALPEDFRQMVTAMLGTQPNAQGQLQIKRSGHW